MAANKQSRYTKPNSFIPVGNCSTSLWGFLLEIKKSRYSPSGSIELRTVNEAAAAKFEIGKEYYVDSTAA